jgi:hypothetical protein
MCPSHRVKSWSHYPRSRATQRGRKAKAAPRRGIQRSAAKDSIETGVLHRASLQRGILILAQIATTLLHERLPWVTVVLYPTASERGEGMLAMLFWVLAALAVVGALAIVWVLYLLVRRWL